MCIATSTITRTLASDCQTSMNAETWLFTAVVAECQRLVPHPTSDDHEQSFSVTLGYRVPAIVTLHVCLGLGTIAVRVEVPRNSKRSAAEFLDAVAARFEESETAAAEAEAEAAAARARSADREEDDLPF